MGGRRAIGTAIAALDPERSPIGVHAGGAGARRRFPFKPGLQNLLSLGNWLRRAGAGRVQGWTSDDTDAVERLRIQWGTSLVYPLSSIGAHVSAVPNHQLGRVTPLATRAAVAFFGVLGYELDPATLTDFERSEIAGQIAFYKEHRSVLQRGRFIRLVSPFDGDGNDTAWMAVARDGRQAVVGCYQVLNRPERSAGRLRLRGLDPAASYRVSSWPLTDDDLALANSGVRGGDELTSVGLFLGVSRLARSVRGDFWSTLFVLDRI